MKLSYLCFILFLLKISVFGKIHDFNKYNANKFLNSVKGSENSVMDDNLKPIITWKRISPEDSGDYGRVYLSSDSDTIVIFTFNSYQNPKNWSNLYVTRDLGISLQKIKLTYMNKNVTIDDVFVHKNVIIAVNQKENVFFASKNGGITFTNISTGYSYVEEVVFHPRYSDYIAAITKDGGRLFVSKDSGEKWNLYDYNIVKFKWSPKSAYYYYTSKSYTDQNSHNLYRGNGDKAFQYETLLSDVIDLDTSNDLVYATTKGKNGSILHISKDDGPFKDAIFPHYLKPIEFQVRHSTENDIFVYLNNDTYQHYLYSALSIDLRFTRIAEIVPYQLHEDFFVVCNDIKIFENLPGVIIGNIKTEYVNETIHPSMISYTHGVHWAHVSPPLTPEIPECNWPSCYFSLRQSCNSLYGEGVITVNKAPHLFLAHGNIVDKNKTSPTNFYISSDAGLTWSLARTGYQSFTVLNHGSVIVAYPEQSNQIYYSYDEGHEWYISSIGISDFYAQVTYHDESSKALASIGIGYDPDDYTIVMVRSDFSKVLKNSCTENDYVDFTPGETSKTQCFQGKKNHFKKRIHETICFNDEDDLTSPDSVDCPCSEDDFGCSFGNYMHEGKCISDPDHIKENPQSCTFGTFHFKESKRRKLIGDSCISSNESEVTVGICGLDEESRAIVLRVGSTYRMMDISNGIPTNLVTFPLKDNLRISTGAFDIDISKGCLFFTTDSGIRKLCWDTVSNAEISNSLSYLYEKDIHSLQIDNLAQNLYFRDSNGLNIMSIERRYRRLIIPTKSINLFKIFPLKGLVVYAENLDSTRENITISDMSGSSIRSFIIDGNIIAATQNVDPSTYDLYTTDKLYSININTGIINQSAHSMKNLIEVEFKYGTTYMLTKTGIMYNGSLIEHPQFDEMHIYHNLDFTKNPCSKSLCQYLCAPVKDDSYKCLCPNGMTLVNNSNCVCEEQNPNCTDCEGNEFRCDNEKCVAVTARCNGVNDCGDGSDEKNCHYQCNADQFICGDSSTCIGIEFLCDGVNNCPDGFDEKDCKQINPCSGDEFKCLNGICIPKNKVCDGQNNCGDYSDEENCKNEKCKKFEFECEDGGCILLEHVCDGKFDCYDWSDEKNCKSDDSNSTKPDNCTIECNGKCIPKSKVCDRITDCEDRVDELDCGYQLECPISKNLICPKQSLCYGKEGTCDGFDTCNDGADEVGCGNEVLCNHPFNFHCKTTDQCILASKYCNGVQDCPDNSDEEEDCLKKPRVTTVYANRINFKSINLTFKSIYKKPEEPYLVSLIPWKHNKTQNLTITTLNESAFFDNLEPCSEYIAHITLSGIPVGVKYDFVTHARLREEPTKLTFNTKESLLSWDSNNYTCQPEVFYVNCVSGNNVIYHNFTRKNNINIFLSGIDECKVASCGYSVYNLTCSKFSDPLTFKSSTKKGSQAAIAIIVIICLLGLGIGCYLLYKYIVNKRIQFILPTRFRRFFRLKQNVSISDPDHDRLIGGDDEDDLLDTI